MRDSSCVIAQAVNGRGPKLAEVLEVSPSRMYEILSTDNPYPKTKRLIRAIAVVNREGCRLIKADLDAMFADILSELPVSTVADCHRESSEAVQAALDDRPVTEQKKECVDAIAAWSARLRDLERPATACHPTADTRGRLLKRERFNVATSKPLGAVKDASDAARFFER